MHGVMMVFFFLIPSIPATLGNFLIPMMIGAKDLAFPKLNLASWYIYVLGGLFTLYALVAGGVDTGWTFYTPFSTVSSTTNVIPTAFGIFITGFSSILTGLNFIVTIHRMRAPGMTWFRMPLFLWSMYATSMIFVLGTPVLAITMLLVAAERLFHFGFFDPAARRRSGAVPASVLVLLPPGRLHHGVAGDGRRQRTGRRLLPQARVRLLVRGLRQRRDWRAQLPRVGTPPVRRRRIRVLGADFLGLQLHGRDSVRRQGLQLDGDDVQGSISWETPMLYAMGFIGLFTMGGLTGLFLAAVGLDVHVTDTYFIIAHFHYIMVGGALMGYLGGLHYLVAEDQRAALQRVPRQAERRDHLSRVQPHVLPAVHSRISRDAAPVPRVPAGISDAERAVVGGRIDSRDRLPDSHGVPDVVAALRSRRRRQPVGRRRSRVDDDIAAADREFRGDADRDLGRVSV